MSRICVSLAEPGLERCLAALQGLDLAEIRLDRTGLSLGDIRILFRSSARLIATFRPDGGSEEEREGALRAAIESGAAYVDLELEASPASRDRLIAAARAHRRLVIVSHHDFVKTPARAELENIREACFRAGADIAKIACRAQEAADSARLLALYETPRPLIALGLGEAGLVTRIAALFLGAPFTYAALEPGKETADGQLDAARLRAVFDVLRHG
jgi:3-dehydroquinate dehydratase type I